MMNHYELMIHKQYATLSAYLPDQHLFGLVFGVWVILACFRCLTPGS